MPASPDVQIRAFTAEKVRAITGLTLRKLQYWDEQGFIRPSLTSRTGRGRKRLYSFQDLVALQVTAKLQEAGIPLRRVRKVVEHLRGLNYDHPLAQLTFRVEGGDVYFHEADTWRAGRMPPQVVGNFVVALDAIAEDLEARVLGMEQRTPGRIEAGRRGKVGGRPVIQGTRIPVETVQRLSGSGLDETAIQDLYPDLTSADIAAAVAAELPQRRHRRAS